MSPIERSYAVQGLRLLVRIETPPLLEALEDLLAPFATDDLSGVDYSLRLCLGRPSSSPQPPENMRQLWRGVPPNGIETIYWTGPALRRVDLLGLARLDIDFGHRRAEITVAPDALWALATGCVAPMLVEMLRRVDQHALHAAAVAAEKDGESRAILVAGASGRGKTTTALALAGGGAALLSDDVTFVAQDGPAPDALAVWGLRFRCKVHRRTLALLPWLNGLPQQPVRTPDEVRVDVRKVLGTGRPVRVPPGIILFLEGPGGGEHRIQPLDKVAALTMLTRENLHVTDRSGDGPAGRAFRMFGRLVGRCDTYSLRPGPDLESLPARIIPLLKWPET